jgi:hypothetical protein
VDLYDDTHSVFEHHTRRDQLAISFCQVGGFCAQRQRSSLTRPLQLKQLGVERSHRSVTLICGLLDVSPMAFQWVSESVRAVAIPALVRTHQ